MMAAAANADYPEKEQLAAAAEAVQQQMISLNSIK